jgi:type IV pilus assembly protein PilE
VIVAENADGSNYSFLMTSTGIQCKNKSYDNIEDNIKGADDASCGTGAETW